MVFRCTDPECPKCGCNQSHLLYPINGGRQEKRRCGNMACSHVFTATVKEEESRPRSRAPVPFASQDCPACGSPDTVVTKSTPPLRSHKCRKCGHPFQSTERDRRREAM